MDLILEDKFKEEHKNKLEEIYKKLFGYYRTTDAEVRSEIEVEAKQLAKDLSDELARVVGEIRVYDEDNQPNS